MSVFEEFSLPKEKQLTDQFLRDGYIIQPVDHRDALDELRQRVVKIVAEQVGEQLPADPQRFLDDIHKILPVEKLNQVRLAVYNQLNATSWFRPTYFALARTLLETLVGNELAMQNRINLSIQFPNDESSLLGIHSDAWSGETPFQVVVWLPLVDVTGTKSMYILDPESNRTVNAKMKGLAENTSGPSLFDVYKDKLTWLDIPYGSVMAFSPNLLHGNVVNTTAETRWSFNCRFTGLFTPYVSSEKSLGNFYLPITTRVVSRIGMKYRSPEGFGDE